MALVRVKGVLDHVLDKNLQDLVRGIRNHKDTEGKYISECIEEIKQELKQESLVVKANAINKLVYLQMLGYDISWAGFNIVEVMSSPKFTFKRIGYLAASQSFHDGTDVIMLTTNLVRKDLNSTNTYDAGVALSSLSCFMTGDLAHDLANDIMVLMTSTKPYLRKKAVLLMYKVFLRFPDSLKPAFGRLKEKLEDPDPGVQSAAVNVICELARKNPQNYLSLAPLFFKLMTTSTNNWVLIKIIKLFGALIPLEPRLGKKLIEPLTNLIHSTSAMSLLYECINTVIAVLISISSGLQNHATSVQLCVQKLQILIEDSDQNLKYLGLLAMTKILKTHPKSVQAHKELIMQCLDDKDESIRLRALSLLYGMVSKKNLMEIVKKLIVHMEKAEGAHYRDELLSKIIGICSQNDYRFITNFEWYVSVLVELAAHKGMKPAQGRAIANQLLDVAIRVQQVRRFAARQMSLLLRNHTLLLGGGAGGSAGGGAGGGGSGSGGGATSGGGGGSAGLVEVLYAAAWICGEFAVCLAGDEESEDARRATLEAMSLPYVLQLPGEVQAVFVHNQVKLYANLLLAESDAEERVALTTELLTRLEQFVHSEDLEVQERAVCAHQLLKCTAKALRQAAASKTAAIFDVGDVATEDGAGSTAEADGDAVIDRVAKELSGLFAGELNPVAPKAQRKVPLPEGLDLDAWINEPPAPPKSEFDEPVKRKSGKSSGRKKEPEAAVSATVGASASGATNYSSSDPTVAWGGASGGGFEQKEYHQPSEAELAAMRETRLREQESNPNYLKSSSSAKRLASDESNHFGRVQSQYEKPGEGLDDEDSQLPRVASMDSGMPTLRIEGLSSSDKYLMQHKQEQSKQKAMKLAEKAAASAVEDGKKKKKKKTKRQLMKEKAAAATSSSKPETNRDEDDEDDEEDDNLAGSHVVSTAYDMPENAAPDSDNEAEAGPASRLAPDDPHRQLANIKIDDLVAMGGRGGAVSSTEFGNSTSTAAEVAAATTKRKVATKKKKKSAAAGDDDSSLQEKPKKEKKKKGGEKKAGKKKKAKAAEASEDLLLLGLDDDAAVQPPRLWLPVGESLTARIDIAWQKSAQAGQVDLTFRIVPLADGTAVKSATVDLEGYRSSKGLSKLDFDVANAACIVAIATGVDASLIGRPDNKLRASLAISWSGAASSTENMKVRVPRLCRLVPAAMSIDELQSVLAGQQQKLAQSSAKLDGLSFDECLKRWSCLAHVVHLEEASAATLHCRSGDVSLYLLVKKLGERVCGVEAKSTDDQLATDCTSEAKKLLAKSKLE
ncbi:hypothetical protein BOX15_Mlig015612g2 [Macrostomum lignano]|uniref:AP-3 complex subunit delta domain-containing protein n=1 Tax=Macrostomum lignano TaxID=282301 RepID=A0A267FPX8_9PLAT|nr:hypothetical protein BOX15_Mlig015612g2 [Macrostomum lignano]